MTPTDVYWMSLVSAYNQALCHRDAAQRIVSTNRFNAWVGAAVSVLVVTLSLVVPTGSKAAPILCAALVAVTSVFSGLLVKAASKTAKSWEQIAVEAATKIVTGAPSSDDAMMQFFISQVKSCATKRQFINLLV